MMVNHLSLDNTPTPLALGNLANAALNKTYSLGEKKVMPEFLDYQDGEPRVRAVRQTAR